MKVSHTAGKLLTAVVFGLVVFTIVFQFNKLFPALGINALLDDVEKNDTHIDIPSDLNFLNDDKRSFINYCKTIYGNNLPLAVDNDKFIYYGMVDGYRLYRLQPNLVPYEQAQQTETLGGHVFYSDCLYRPSKTGLYLINDLIVISIDDAYRLNLVDIDNVYELYSNKIISEYPKLKNMLT